MVQTMTAHNSPQQPRTLRGYRRIAAYAGLSNRQVCEALDSGALPRLVGTGRYIVVLRDDVDAWVESLRATTEAAS